MSTDPEAIIADLNPAQREAALAVSGPVCILAGAGTGKTRVITRRAAYALATGAVEPANVLVVTFTEKAAAEMKARLGALGHRSVAARTFHSAALLQLRHFWPRISEAPLPDVLDSKIGFVAQQLSRENVPYRFMPARDFAEIIEWAKVRRVTPGRLGREIEKTERAIPAPIDVVTRVWKGYERTKERAGRIDFEDMLGRTVEMLEEHADIAEEVRARYQWFSVDEYQDTNALQEALLRLWLGERRDIAVVGDPDQTIYSFTGATSDYLTGFPRRYPGTRIVELRENYRSSPQVIELANRLASPGRTKGEARLVATCASGPSPTIARSHDEDTERDEVVRRLRALERDGVPGSETAVLVRTNAQIAELEEALTRAGIGYVVRGERFYARRDVRDALAALRRLDPERRVERPKALGDAVAAAWAESFGFERDAEPAGDAARERQAALETLLAIADELREPRSPSIDELLAELDARAAHERDGQADGVTLSTIHRAKGLEWDAVLLPAWEEDYLPHAAAKGPAELAEERRLAYVAITRARRHLWIGWAARRRGSRGGIGNRTPSRFLEELAPPRAAGVLRTGPVGAAATMAARARPISRGYALPIAAQSPPPVSSADPTLVATLREWRRRTAAGSGVPAYVVMPDVTLLAIAERRPDSVEMLASIKGLGPTRVAAYADAIIGICARKAS